MKRLVFSGFLATLWLLAPGDARRLSMGLTKTIADARVPACERLSEIRRLPFKDGEEIQDPIYRAFGEVSIVSRRLPPGITRSPEPPLNLRAVVSRVGCRPLLYAHFNPQVWGYEEYWRFNSLADAGHFNMHFRHPDLVSRAIQNLLLN